MTRIEKLTDDFLKFISDKKNKRKSIASEYASFIITEAMNHGLTINWKLINAQILKRYKTSGLLFIKYNAWKIVESL